MTSRRMSRLMRPGSADRPRNKLATTKDTEDTEVSTCSRPDFSSASSMSCVVESFDPATCSTKCTVGAAVLTLMLALSGCGNRTGGPPRAEPWFVDATRQAGLTFTHFNGMSGDFLYPEIMPPGIALLDYDNDGDLDIFVVQGQMLGKRTIGNALFPPSDPAALRARLFRNDLAIDDHGTRTLRFTDVTGTSRIDARGYGMGAATGDVNHDGCVDLYVTNLRANQLFRNNCDGTFTDVAKQRHPERPGWGGWAGFVRIDPRRWVA